jgi:hypothetical protein
VIDVVFGSETRAFIEFRLKMISFLLHSSESMMLRHTLSLQIRTPTGIWRRGFCPSRQSGNWTSIADGTLFRKSSSESLGSATKFVIGTLGLEFLFNLVPAF